MGFSVWLAILSLLASIHADVFEQEDNALVALFVAPVKRLWPGHPAVDLSSLLSAGEPQPSTAQASPLYIFMLDLSKSMRDQSVSAQEVGRYLEEIGASSYSGSTSPVSGCLVQEGDARGIDIARSELCRYIESLPLNARAALWSFGSSPEMVMPLKGSLNGDRYVLIENDQSGGNSRRKFFPAIMGLEANQVHTDFDRLLAEISGVYSEEIDKDGQEVHFVVISDFVHDIGGKQSEKDSHLGIDGLEDSIWQSRYRASLFSIGDRLREMSRTSGKTFHLAVVRGARRAICSVLPVATESFGWDDYRELRLESQAIGSEFDFLNAYQETNTPITFYYTPGSAEPEPLYITVDSEEYEKAKLRIGLASRASTAQSFPLDIRASLDGKTGFARIGQSFAGEVGREDDKITLQPQSVISPREATTYRLLFSWQKDGESGQEETTKRTFTAPVVFKRQLSLHGALAMVGSIAAVSWFLVRMMSALWHLYRLRRSEQDQEAGPEGTDATRIEAPIPPSSPTPPARTSSAR